MKQLSAVSLFFFFLAAPCFSEPPKYKIGVLLPLTGNFANYGKAVREGVEKVQHPEIEWVFEDEACEPGKAVTAFKKLATADGIPFFIGPCCGSPQKAIAPLLPKGNQLVLLPNAAPASVFLASGKKMYSVQYSLDAEAAFIAQSMNERGLRRAAIIYDDNDFSRALEQAFLKVFKGEVVFTQRSPAFDVESLRTAALKLRGTAFDSLFIPDAAPFLLGFLTIMKRAGVAQRPVFSVYAAQMPDILTAEGENAEGLLYSYPDVPGDQDAFGYFPTLAAKLLAQRVAQCKGSMECVLRLFKEDGSFTGDGTLGGKIVLKTIRDGKFVLSEGTK